MKSPQRRSSISLMLCLAYLLIQSVDGGAQTVLAVNEVRVVSTTGSVAAKSVDGKTVTITLTNTPGAEPPIAATQGPGSTLATGAASNAFISIPTAGSFMMAPNTQVKMPKADEKGHTLELLKGQLFMNINANEIKKRGNTTFRLKTPAALLAVKGTRFFAVSAGAADTIGVNQGSVEVNEPDTNQTLVLNTGNAVSVSMGLMGKERPLTKEETIYEKFYSMAVPPGGFTNSLGMKFVPVPGTQVQFCIHEVRRRDYETYANETPGTDDSWKSQNEDGIPCGHEANHPVVGVNWHDAKAFCAWLSNREGRTYRLPTDREWSVAVDIGHKEKWTKESTPQMLHMKLKNEFPWGRSYPPKTDDLAGNYADTTWREKFPTNTFPSIPGYTDGFATTAPVMSFRPNKFGIHDLGGNVSEWCEDLYFTDPAELPLDTREERGGGWSRGDQNTLNSSYRGATGGIVRNTALGLRVVVEAR